MQKKLKTVFMGTPDFSVPCLEILHHHFAIDLVSVVSMPDRPAGRGQNLKSPPVIEYAKENKIKFLQTENINKEDDFLDELEKQNIDLIIVLAFAQFLGARVLNISKVGCFNIHTSILPKYRGAAPIQYALLNGDKTTGVSIQKMVKKMDAGDLVLFHELPIHPEETGGLLYSRLKLQAGLSLNEFINVIINNEIKYTPQDETQVSFAPTLKKEDGLLRFDIKTFDELKNQIRAFDPWPGTYCFLGKKRLKVFSLEVHHKKLKAGEVFAAQGELIIGTLDKSVRLTSVQLEGKNICNDTDLLKGFREEIIINQGLNL